jgi:hypothetical protein
LRWCSCSGWRIRGSSNWEVGREERGREREEARARVKPEYRLIRSSKPCEEGEISKGCGGREGRRGERSLKVMEERGEEERSSSFVGVSMPGV